MNIDIKDTLASAPSLNIQTPGYDPKSLTAGIAHIGVGNFHRAHQAYYTDKFLNLSNHAGWGIIGIGITASGKAMAENFVRQENLYTLTEYEVDGSAKVSVVGSIIDYVPAREDQEKAIEYLADPNIKIVSLTITEGGYKLDEYGEFLMDDTAILHDLANPSQPQTAFGYVIEALARRRQRGVSPFTILSCDNLQHNGDVAKKAFLAFAGKKDTALALWISENVTFPNSMVDRITPATTEGDLFRLNSESGVIDAIPVFCEAFTQWIIEDDFCSGRPDWEIAGVTFVKNVAPYEAMKLSFLNASHSMLAYPAFLAGYRNVDEAMRDDLFSAYLRDFMNKDVTPLVASPPDVDLEKYKAELMERFANPAVSDQLERLCYHGGVKIPTFILPTLKQMLEKKMDIRRIAFLLAAYGHYLKSGKDDNGVPYEVNAPKLNKKDWEKIKDSSVLSFLTISPLAPGGLQNFRHFVELYTTYRIRIGIMGVVASLHQMNTDQE